MKQQTRRLMLWLAPVLLAAGPVARGDDPAVDLWQGQRITFDNFVRHMKPLNKRHIEEVMQIRVEKKLLVLLTPLPNMPTEEQQQAHLAGIHGTVTVVVLRSDNRKLVVMKSGATLSQLDHVMGLARQLGLQTQVSGGPTAKTVAVFDNDRSKDLSRFQALDGVEKVVPDWGEPDQFRMQVVDFPAPKRSSNLGVTTSNEPSQLMIMKTVQITNGPSQQVIISQQRGPQSNGGGMIQLSVTEFRAPGAAVETLNYGSPDFFTFLRQHPREANMYVRPLLRELGQESVFAPEPMIVWQVFNDLWKPDPQIARRVEELLPKLNADDYHERDSALAKLQHLGRDGAAVLMHMDRSKLSPEQNARVDRALSPYAQLGGKEVARLKSDPGFLLDCLYADDAALRKAAAERLRAVAKPDLQFDVNADRAARSAAVAALRQQLLPLASQSGK